MGKNWALVQQVQNSAFPPNRTNEFNIDTSNKFLPRLTLLFYQGDAQNSSLLNNPGDRIQNLDLSSQSTYIKPLKLPFYTTNEQYGTVLPIEVNNSMLPLGLVYVKKKFYHQIILINMYSCLSLFIKIYLD